MVTPETLRHGILERLDCVISMQPASMHSFDASSWPLPIPDSQATGRFVRCQEALCGRGHERTHTYKA